MELQLWPIKLPHTALGLSSDSLLVQNAQSNKCRVFISIDVLTSFSSTSYLFTAFPSSRGWCWRAPLPRRLLPLNLPSTEPSSPATPRTPPSLERGLKGAPMVAQAPPPKSPVQTEQLTRPVPVLSWDKRSKPKRSQTGRNQRAARRRTSQAPARSAFFTTTSSLIHSLVTSGLKAFCWNHFNQTSRNPAPQCGTIPRKSTHIYAVWPGNPSRSSGSLILKVCVWWLPAVSSRGVWERRFAPADPRMSTCPSVCSPSCKYSVFPTPNSLWIIIFKREAILYYLQMFYSI